MMARTTWIQAGAVFSAVLAAVALAACGSQESTRGGGAGVDRSATQIGQPMTGIVPAQIDPRPHAFVSLDVLRPVTNGWRAGSHERLTEVDAGAVAGDPATGAFAIFRHDFLTATQTVNIVKVQDAGPLRITKAPTGAGAVESAQRDGQIEFTGARGLRGTLDLSNDTIATEGG